MKGLWPHMQRRLVGETGRQACMQASPLDLGIMDTYALLGHQLSRHSQAGGNADGRSGVPHSVC